MIIGYSGLMRDVTNLIKTQHKLQKEKERAEQADKLKSTFLANMSHEIRTPLNAIIGFSGLLQSVDSEEEKNEYINIINTNNELLLRLIEDILDLSKIESGIIELNSEEFDMCQLFEEGYANFKLRILNKDIKLSLYNPYHTCRVELDRNRILQLLSNFVTNAIKYTEEGEIHMGFKYENNGLKIFVEDTGIGIAEENHLKVFSRFEKFDSFAQGTGLGLAICKAITEAMNGTIGFNSEKGKGSIFWAWIPCSAYIKKEINENETDKNNNERIIKINEPSSKYKILIAEDNDSNYLLISTMLRKHKLHRAANGMEAVRLFNNNKYDIVLMDIRMPIMNGLEATMKIRENNKTTPIIGVTANAYDVDKKRALEAGCNMFITKPIKREELENIIFKLKDSVKV